MLYTGKIFVVRTDDGVKHLLGQFKSRREFFDLLNGINNENASFEFDGVVNGKRCSPENMDDILAMCWSGVTTS